MAVSLSRRQSNRTSVALAESEGKSSAPSTAADPWAAVQTAWASIPVDLVQTLVDSLPRRVEPIRSANGGWTKCLIVVCKY